MAILTDPRMEVMASLPALVTIPRGTALSRRLVLPTFLDGGFFVTLPLGPGCAAGAALPAGFGLPALPLRAGPDLPVWVLGFDLGASGLFDGDITQGYKLSVATIRLTQYSHGAG